MANCRKAKEWETSGRLRLVGEVCCVDSSDAKSLKLCLVMKHCIPNREEGTDVFVNLCPAFRKETFSYVC